MGASFFEVMRGQLAASGHGMNPVDVEIKVEATHLRQLLRTGKARVTGVVHAPPWAELAAAEGEIRIDPVLGREIAYRIGFHDAEGRECALEGKKTMLWSRPFWSFTHLRVVLTREGEELAQGHLRFSWDDLGTFLKSFRPWSSIRPIELHKPIDHGASPFVLSPHARATMAAFAEVCVTPGRAVPPMDPSSVDEALVYLQNGPIHVARMYGVGLRWLDLASRLRTRRAFVSLSAEARRELLIVLENGARGSSVRHQARRRMLQLLGGPLRAVHFSRPAYLRGIGHRPFAVAPPPEALPRWFERVIDASALPGESDVHAEVVIIGTGAGGAVLAAELAQRGIAVALIEEGPFLRRHDFFGDPNRRVAAAWRDGGMHFSLGNPVNIPLGRVVGGTTTINSGTCFATPDHVLGEWRNELGFPSAFAPEAYHAYSKRVLERLQVAPGEAKVLGRIAKVIGRGADAMGLAHGPLPRNAPGCTGAGECIFGCPEGAKQSTDLSFIPRALSAGAELYCGLPVTRILMRGSRAVAVVARGPDANGVQKTLRIFADRIVLAAGAIGTPSLLEDNGFRLPWIGKNLSVHPAMGVIARCTEDLEPWAAIPQGYAIHALEEDEIRYEGYYVPPSLLGGVLPWTGPELTRWMDDFPRLGQFGFMVRDRGDGWVKKGPDGRPIVGYFLSKRSAERLQKGAALLSEVFFHAGASEVYVGIGPKQVLQGLDDAKAFAHANIGRAEFNLLGAHPLGTCRMGASAETAVVDFEHKVFGTDNLYIVDGSVIPTSLGVNPQVTIMSFALRAAEMMGG